MLGGGREPSFLTHLGHQRRLAPAPQAASQKLGHAEAALLLAQQHQPAVGGEQAAVECRRHFLGADGWKIEGKKAIVGHGGCGKSVASVESRQDNEFLHDFNELCHTRRPDMRPDMDNPA
jgi:hypothetical protein